MTRAPVLPFVYVTCTLLVLAACSGASEPEVVAYPLTADQVAAVKEAAGQNMLPEHLPPTDAEWETVCNNFESVSWDYDRVLELEVVTATSRARAAHGELLVWLWEITGVSGVDNSPRLLKGFCR